MTIDLAECRVKIKRAREHRELLEEVVAPVREGKANRIQISAKLDNQSGNHVFRVAAVPEAWRLRVGVILGDVVHNLRSTLSLLFWQLYCHHIGTPTKPGTRKRVEFPIKDTYEGFRNKWKEFTKIPISHGAVIRHAQPYRRANPSEHPICVLNKLWDRDKHRTLNPVLMRTHIFQFAPALTGRCDPINLQAWTCETQRLEIGAEVMQVRCSPNVNAEVEVAGYMTPSIRLPESDLPLIDGVDDMFAWVEGIVSNIEARL